MDKNYRLCRKTVFFFNTEKVEFWNLGDNETVIGLHGRTVTRRPERLSARCQTGSTAISAPASEERVPLGSISAAMPEQAAFLLASAQTVLGSSTVTKNTTGHKKGLFPSLRNSYNETAGLKLTGSAHTDVYKNTLITEGEVAAESR